MIQPKGPSAVWLAGLYRIENGLPVFSILTREPNTELRRIHDRMPLMFPKNVIDGWIYPGNRAEDYLPYAITDTVMEKAAE